MECHPRRVCEGKQTLFLIVRQEAHCFTDDVIEMILAHTNRGLYSILEHKPNTCLSAKID